MDLEKLYVSQKAHVKMRLGYVEISSPSVSKNTQNQKKNRSILKNQKINVKLLKIQKIMNEILITHINISTQIEEIREITIIKVIIHLILIGRIRFILEIQMVDFMN
jgi:hypothetical protein